MKNTAPILLLLYNRPLFAKKQLSLIAKTSNSNRIYISIDGPKNKDDNGVFQVREIVNTYKEELGLKVTVRQSSKNLGCKRGVSLAISWFFKNVDEGIILEDDCIPDKTFFKYATNLLSKYKDDSRIGMISGTNPLVETYITDSYFFSNQSIIWGWATWKDRWQDYYLTEDKALQFLDKKTIVNYLLTKTTKKHIKVLSKVLKYKIDTWDYIWYFTNILTSRYCIIPKTNLVSNIGFEVKATHTNIKTEQAEIKTTPLSFPLKHPLFITTNKDFETRYLKQIKMSYVLVSIVKAKLKSLFSS